MADLTLEELISRRAALRLVRTSGVLKLKHGDTETTYRSDADIWAALRDLDRLIAAFGTSESRVSVASYRSD